MDRIDLFRIFVRVVECASFTRAADTLGLPRSTVSVAIQTLEARLGARLLHRTTRKVAPTRDGDAFYEHCLRLLADIEEAESLFRQGSAGPSGRLRVNVPGRIGRLVIAPALPDFLARYPGIEIELGVTDRMVDLIEEGIDCVLRVGPPGPAGLIGRTIGVLPLINVASPSYLAQHGRPDAPADLPGHQVVRYASPSTGRVEEWEWMEAGEVRHCPVRGRVTTNSAEACIACCLAGLGLIQIPAYDVQPHLLAGELVEVMPDFQAEPMPMTLLHPDRRHPSRRLRTFGDWLATLLKRELRI